VVGAAIAVADGLVWAELGAAFPRAGGSYAFLREIYGPEGAGNWLSFLYVWQVSFTAPLSIASGCIGLASFLAWFWPGLEAQIFPAFQLHVLDFNLWGLHQPLALTIGIHYSNLAAAGVCLLVTALLYRNLSSVTRLAWVLFAGVLAALGGVVVSGFAQAAATGGWQMPTAPAMVWPAALGGLAQATLLTTYCYWGYYNICFLGGEVKRPERTIPRAILLSVALVAAIYVAMDLAALPALREAAARAGAGGPIRSQLVADLAQSAFGAWAGRLMASLILWTAFGSVFSLLLGYSRVPYAAARDGNYFQFLAAVHPRHKMPHRSLVALGLTAAAFCFFSLAQVITMLVVTRILLQFFLQHIGVMVLRVRQPERTQSFRMALYPLPPLVAMAGFVFMLVNRSHALGGLAVAGGIACSGTVIYLFRAKRLGQWPFLGKQAG
jgi:amino acid transporter